MSWHYQLRQRSDKGETWYDIVEAYENPTGWTRDGVSPAADSPEGVIETLEHMLNDAQAYPVLIDKEED